MGWEGRKAGGLAWATPLGCKGRPGWAHTCCCVVPGGTPLARTPRMCLQAWNSLALFVVHLLEQLLGRCCSPARPCCGPSPLLCISKCLSSAEEAGALARTRLRLALGWIKISTVCSSSREHSWVSELPTYPWNLVPWSQPAAPPPGPLVLIWLPPPLQAGWTRSSYWSLG